MSRNRAPIDGGYTRKTVSLPSSLVKRIEDQLKPGETISAFLTVAGEDLLQKTKKR